MIQSSRHSAIAVTLPYDKNAAVVVLPAIGGSRLQDARLKTWLSRAELRQLDQPRELLETILGALSMPYPDEGFAALRMWGQTGDRPTVWIAAADPVYLEPRLDHLCLHSLGGDRVPSSDLSVVVNHLQQTLADDSSYGFARVGDCAYLRSDVPIATADSPSYVIDGQMPNDFMPSGEDSGDYRGLRSEVEMSLHEHELNERREADGMLPINSLWLWGGGYAPEQRTVPHPPLFASNALLRGYWLSNTGVVEHWPGSITSCLEASLAGFVAVPTIETDDVEALQACLHELRTALLSGRLSQLRLFFQDGLEASVLPSHAWRVWRRPARFFA